MYLLPVLMSTKVEMKKLDCLKPGPCEEQARPGQERARPGEDEGVQAQAVQSEIY